MKKTVLLSLIFTAVSIYGLTAQALDPVPITEEWIANIAKIAPSKPTVKANGKRKVLVFSKATGYDHWTIPHNVEMLKVLAKKTGAFQVHIGYDIAQFEHQNLKNYDAVVFNNCNPSGPDRDLFADLLRMNTSLSESEIKTKAPHYEDTMMDYVKKGGGLMILHGAITVQNNSMAFSEMTGGSFDYHPPQQKVHAKEVDPNHPLVKAFKGNGLVHIDEPYFFKNAYFNYNFRPLLYMETSKLEGLKQQGHEDKVYISWIKKYGKGRVFYTSPSHNAQSLENPDLLQFFLDGLQYVTGDLKVDDSPMEIKK